MNIISDLNGVMLDFCHSLGCLQYVPVLKFSYGLKKTSDILAPFVPILVIV